MSCRIDAPDMLYLMRRVSVGQVDEAPLALALATMLKEKPVPFSEKMAALETEYWASKKATPNPTAVPSGPDVGSDTSIEVAEGWLEEHGVQI